MSHSVTTNFGGFTQNLAAGDSGNQLFLLAQQITPTANSTVASLGAAWSASASSEWGMALYTDSGGAPSSKICAVAAASSTSGFNSLTPSGCGTLTSGTPYWVVWITSDGTQNPMMQNFTKCPNGVAPLESNLALGSFTSAASFPSTFPANGNAHSISACYQAYAALTYTSSNTFDIVSFANSAFDTGSLTFTASIPPTQSGSSLIVAVQTTTGEGTTTGVTDAINGTLTDTLTQFGTCSSASGGFALCVYYICRVTAGVNSVTATSSLNGGSAKPIISVLELQGTASSSCADQSKNATSYITAASFTSGNTPTTTSATEFLYAPVLNSLNGPSGVTDPQTMTPGGSWNTIYYFLSNGSAPNPFGVLQQTVTSTGAYNVSGTYNGGFAGSNNVLPWIGTFVAAPSTFQPDEDYWPPTNLVQPFDTVISVFG